MTVPVALIAAVAENGVIGNRGKIPWRIPSDFGWFKRTTMGKPLIMGRSTFEGLGKPLAGRINIVVSRDPAYRTEGAVVLHSLEDALAEAQQIAASTGANEVMVGGGGQIYAETIGSADRLYVSHVALAPEGDVYFPAIDAADWQVVDSPAVTPDPRDTAAFRVNVYERRNPDQR